MIKKNFWKRKKVLVTGYRGFLGSHLCLQLLEQGADVIGLDLASIRKSPLLKDKRKAFVRTVRGSVANARAIEEILKKHSIQYVFHLAAETIVGECLKNPKKAFTSNIQGTWQVLESCRKFPEIRAVVVASSDKAYGSHPKLPYTETMSLQGRHPYDVSKSCADLIAKSYFDTYRLPVAVTRCGNIYGPGDLNFSRIVPDVVRAMVAGRKVQIRSDGKFTRDYIYVEDVVRGYLLLAEKLQKQKLSGEAFNFSCENPITVLELVKKCYALQGRAAQYAILNQARCEIRHQYLSAAKARKKLSWKASTALGPGLAKTIRWYQDYLKK